MKLSIRSGLVVLWLFAGVLLFTGVYATRTAADAVSPGEAAGRASPVRWQEPAAPPHAQPLQDSAVMSPAQSQAQDSATVIPSGPPATGVGGAETSIEPEAAAAQAEQSRSIRSISEIATPIHQRLVSVLGMLTLLLIAWLLSVNRSMIPWRVVLWGLGLQIIFALLILTTPVGEAFFTWINGVI